MGTFTIKQVMRITYAHPQYNNRFEYRQRDVVKRLQIKEIKEINRHDLPGEPRERTKFWIISKSWPQYPPYLKRNDTRSYQRSVSHEYDIILELDRLSLNTVYWTMRVGSGRKWLSQPPQGMVKTIYPATRKRFRARANRLGKTQSDKNARYKKMIADHQKRAQYLNAGDYNAQVLGINGDWIFRCDFAYYFHGHRFGRNYYGNVPARKLNPNNIVFFPKHAINVIELMMKRGLLKDD